MKSATNHPHLQELWKWLSCFQYFYLAANFSEYFLPTRVKKDQICNLVSKPNFSLLDTVFFLYLLMFANAVS